MKREILILIVLFLMIVTLNYSFLDSFLVKNFQNPNVGFVERVIDGDTAIINNHSVRFLGINSPELKEVGHDEAMNFLKNKIEGKNITLVFGPTKTDLYGRWLAYVFLGSENVNLESIENGYSNAYFPEGKDSFHDDFMSAWESCLEKNINLCEKSDNTCFKLETWDTSGQKVVLKNVCSGKLNITGFSVKDEGRKRYVFGNKVLLPDEEVVLTPKDWNVTYVWTKTGDSIFIRDEKNKLIYFGNY